MKKLCLTFDLAALYEVETKVFNQAVKRNMKRFPKDFMFQLSRQEWNNLKVQMETYNIEVQDNAANWSQFVTGSQKHRSGTALPYVFTEQGVAMLSGILNSDRAISMNIAIMRAFVEIRRILIHQNDIQEQLKLIKEKIGDHDAQLSQIYDAMENLLDEKAAQRKWEDRERIGFK